MITDYVHKSVSRPNGKYGNQAQGDLRSHHSYLLSCKLNFRNVYALKYAVSQKIIRHSAEFKLAN